MLRYEDAPDPEPGEGEVLVELRAASLNHLDVWIRKGLPSVPKPRILGADGAGVIAGTGRAGRDQPGDHERTAKMHIVGETMDGTHAELIAVPRDYVHPIPGDLSFEEAAAFPLVFETAYRMLVTRARLQEGEWVLIWGIGGGVATAALVDREGARRARRSSRRRATRSSSGRAELGADATVNHATGRRRRGGEGGDAAAARTSSSTTSARRRGSARSTPRAPEGADRRLRRDDGPEPAGGAAPRLVEAALDPRLDDGHAGGLPGRLRPDRGRQGAPVVDRVFPLAEARAAHERLEAGEQLGKIVLSIPRSLHRSALSGGALRGGSRPSSGRDGCEVTVEV